MRCLPSLLVCWGLFCPVLLADDFPKPFNTLDEEKLVAPPAKDAVDGLTLPPGFKATLFALEPDVQNPIGMAWDARGRLWIAENYTYADAKTKFDLGLRDRVLIFEDTDGDGKFNTRKVFTDAVQMLTSVEVGHGGVWVMCPPRLMFFPDKNGDDIPDGPGQTMLDGFTVQSESYHNFANGLKWGPDGWLYGRCGGSCPGEIGKPGTPAAERTPLRGGMWRYHPVTGVYETLNTGTTNPWGHDWDALGELFFVNTVNGHFWHSIPGAHFVRNATLDPNPRTYQLIDQHADHFHFDTGKSWQDSRDGAANDLGGGHAHSGATIYLGDNWPEEYRGHLYTVNLHGRRVNNELIEREGCGFTAHHAKDVILSSDPWFRAVDLSYGPDGGVYIIDWSDTGECHERNGVHRTSGRIFKITYGDPKKLEPFDLRKKPAAELIDLLGSPNEWYVRQARLILSERHASKERISISARIKLRQYAELPILDSKLRLQEFLTDSILGGADQKLLTQMLEEPDESFRTWAIRIITDTWPLDGPFGPTFTSNQAVERVTKEYTVWKPEFLRLAATDPSGLVRLQLASTLQRLPPVERVELAKALVSRTEDANDHNMPLLVWYGLIPVADTDPAALVEVAKVCQWPLTRNLIARRLGEDIEKHPSSINVLLMFAASQPDAYRTDIITGLSDALRGWRKAPCPACWKTAQSRLESSADPRLVERVRELSVVFGDGRALDEVKKIALDQKATPEARQAALKTLIENRPDDLRSICEKLVNEKYVNLVAAQGLAQFDDPKIGEQLVKAYKGFRTFERPQIMSILVSRPAFATPMLKAMAKGQIAREDLTSFHVRQLHSLSNAELSKLVSEVWGELRDSSEDKRQQMADLKSKLTDDVLTQGDLSQGRLVFAKTCAKCHKLYGEGEKVGPDLTGSNRNNIDYLLENIVDPSAVVNKDFRMTVLMLADGRVLNGVITEQTDRTLTLQSLTEKVTIDKDDVEESKPTSLSPMPEGMLQTLSANQVRDLIAYLRHASQVALPPDGEANTPTATP
ncbi:PVC-type heme-binding CxxCH protein [Planctomicrobium piriforme]|uniref:Putative membrane-bound dehydrogenase domain-containing protein n=1 Tax=Planctomicrobium piriforme TaxID=1576369 RepID=A0A1I3IH60_9PLAN|nr:PVC-type heme-binding CxxCH protein [Planctomicrobium piriforme]SFI47262.1 putative membrane-bound dehydrogenase domain-containing protein [Planctomicrobium piriforme]